MGIEKAENPPAEPSSITFEQLAGGGWSATATTNLGQLIAIGPTIERARVALEALIRSKLPPD